jgi:hypothetical protein
MHHCNLEVSHLTSVLNIRRFGTLWKGAEKIIHYTNEAHIANTGAVSVQTDGHMRASSVRSRKCDLDSRSPGAIFMLTPFWPVTETRMLFVSLTNNNSCLAVIPVWILQRTCLSIWLRRVGLTQALLIVVTSYKFNMARWREKCDSQWKLNVPRRVGLRGS